MSTATVAPASDLRLGQRIRYWLPAVVVLALALATWQWILPDGLDVEAYLLPRFSDVVSALWNERAPLAEGAWITFKEAFGGFVIGSGLAFSSALLLARWRPFGDALMPYMIAANAIPIIARTLPTFKAVKTNGSEFGIRTRRKTARWGAAYDRISSIDSGFTDVSPRSVFTRTGK